MDTFLDTYQKINRNNIQILKQIYTDDIEFIDPVHKIVGIDNMIQYFTSMYENVEGIEFVFHDHLQKDNTGYVQWQMRFVHKNIGKGKPIVVPGTSYLLFRNEKVFYHRDYFDLGTMVYEHIPLLKNLISLVKKRMVL